MSGTLLASGRADIHCHLLPGVDDGPADMAETVALARRAASDGTRCIVATPHVDRVDVLEIAWRAKEVQAVLREQDVLIAVHAGGELNVGDVENLDDRRLGAIACGPSQALWILLEPPWKGAPGHTLSVTHELQARGYGVVVAHPERSDPLWRQDEEIRELATAGAWLQVTAASLLPAARREVRDRALRVIREHRRVVLASDAHDALRRPPDLSFAHRELAEAGVSAPRRHELIEIAGSRLLARGTDAGPSAGPRKSAAALARSSARNREGG